MPDHACLTAFLKGRVSTYLLGLALAVAVSILLPTSRAEAATCTVPNQVTNGQPADATQLMANFNALNTCINTVINSAVTPTGTPASGNLSVFSGPGTITNGDLTGDCATSGTLAATCTKTNGTAFGYFATGTDAGQLTGTVSVNRFNNGANANSSTFLRGDGTWVTPYGGGSGGALWYFNPPLSSAFPTIVTEGTATNTSVMDDGNIGLVVGAQVAADNFYGIVQPAPAYPFTIIGHFAVTAGTNGSFIQGIVLRNSSTGLRTVFGADSSGGYGGLIVRRSTGTTYNANPQVLTSRTFTQFGGLWLKVIANSDTDVSYYVSGDGKHWSLFLANNSSGQVAGVNQIGFGITARGGENEPGFIVCDYWNVG